MSTGFDAEAAGELGMLRNLEEDLPWDNQAAEALYQASRGLAGLLLDTHPDVVFAAPVRFSIGATGPVTEQYRQTLTPLEEDLITQWRAEPTRRLVRLLIGTSLTTDRMRQTRAVDIAMQRLRRLWRDPHGRLVAEMADPDQDAPDELCVEWPTGLPPRWNARTVIAADPDGQSAFALTPRDDGSMQVDPLPNPGDEPGYAWGYRGSGPTNLYLALVRCVLGSWDRIVRISSDWYWGPGQDRPCGRPSAPQTVAHPCTCLSCRFGSNSWSTSSAPVPPPHRPPMPERRPACRH